MQLLSLLLLVLAAFGALTLHSSPHPRSRPRTLTRSPRLFAAKSTKNKIVPVFDVVDDAVSSGASAVITYTHLALQFKKGEDLELLVASNNNKLLAQLINMKESKMVDMKLIDKGIEDGEIFYASDEDIQRLFQNELNNNKKISTKSFPTKSLSGIAETYNNIGTAKKPIFIKSSKVSVVPDYKKGMVSEESLRRQGYLFDNLTVLFNDEVNMQRLNTIALKLKNEYKLTSPEWKKWTNKTSLYNATSLTQVMAEYFRDYSIGDIGEGGDYVPRKGIYLQNFRLPYLFLTHTLNLLRISWNTGTWRKI